LIWLRIGASAGACENDDEQPLDDLKYGAFFD